jgi:hypothetical protein
MKKKNVEKKVEEEDDGGRAKKQQVVQCIIFSRDGGLRVDFHVLFVVSLKNHHNNFPFLILTRLICSVLKKNLLTGVGGTEGNGGRDG